LHKGDDEVTGLTYPLHIIAAVIFILLVAAAVPALVYCWWLYWKTVHHQAGWRTRANLMVILVITACVLLFPVALAYGARIGSDYLAVEGYYDNWDHVVIPVLGTCLLLSFLAKGRMMPALAVASVGAVCLWFAMSAT
jgi:hypothetical protein